MQAITHPVTVAPARERHFITVALVGALHIAAIYTILVALDIVPAPIPESATDLRVIPAVQHKTIPQPPANPVVLTKPGEPVAPTMGSGANT